MARADRFRVLVAVDGSAAARAALAWAVAFPWPRGAGAGAVIARRGFAEARVAWPPRVWAALDRSLARVRDGARRGLRRRWPDAEALVVDRPAAAAILAEADRAGADVIVVGSRGHNAVGRLVLGSVSRDVVRQARVPVLVAKGRPRHARRLVLALDGSPNARRAARLIARLPAPPGGRVTVVRVVDPVRVPSMGLVPSSVRRAVRAQAAALAARSVQRARREVDAVAARLARGGWAARAIVLAGIPLPALLGVVASDRADVLVLGARGVGGIARLLLGSVAGGALTRAPVPVLVVR